MVCRKSLFTMLSGTAFVTYLLLKIVPITVAQFNIHDGARVFWWTLGGMEHKQHQKDDVKQGLSSLCVKGIYSFMIKKTQITTENIISNIILKCSGVGRKVDQIVKS